MTRMGKNDPMRVCGRICAEYDLAVRTPNGAKKPKGQTLCGTSTIYSREYSFRVDYRRSVPVNSTTSVFRHR